jgi:hypothetical protein
MEYIYTSSTKPNIETFESNVILEEDEFGNMHIQYVYDLCSGVLYDIQNSEMTDKNIDYLSWEEEESKIYVYFQNELSSNDKTILDQIISDNT